MIDRAHDLPISCWLFGNLANCLSKDRDTLLPFYDFPAEQPSKICILDDQLGADKLRSFSCVQRYVSALAAAAELQRDPGLARSG
jgi:hypothetical protein